MKYLFGLCLVFAFSWFASPAAFASGDPPKPATTWDAPTPPARAAPPDARTTPVSKPAAKKRSR